jgi:pimeloyl-ACP methyl ester carboxylesterase
VTAADFAFVDSLLDPYPIVRVATSRGAVSYRQAGTGATSLVLLHGIGSQSGSWVQQFEGLAAGFRAIAWDAPGYGDSDPIETESPGASEYAASLGSFLAELGIRRPVIVASSLGALIATSYAAIRPDGIMGLVLLNPAGGYGLAEPSAREEKLAARLARLARLGPRGMAENLPGGMLSVGASNTARGIASWSQARIDPRGYAQAARMLAHGTLVKDAVRFDGPVLVVAASADTITPVQDCESIARAFPRATFQILDGPGHLSYVEAPDTVNALIAKFAESCIKGSEA